MSLFAREWRARDVAPRRIADHAREVADQEDDGVSHVLEMFELANEDSMAQVQVGRGWIEAGFYAQRFAGSARLLQLLAQLGFANDLRGAFANVGELLVNRCE